MPFDGTPPETTIAPEVQILLGARDLLLTKGWIQHSLYSRGGYCISGAIEYALPEIPSQERYYASVKAREIIRRLIAPKVSWWQQWFFTNTACLVTWNDALGRT